MDENENTQNANEQLQQGEDAQLDAIMDAETNDSQNQGNEKKFVGADIDDKHEQKGDEKIDNILETQKNKATKFDRGLLQKVILIIIVLSVCVMMLVFLSPSKLVKKNKDDEMRKLNAKNLPDEYSMADFNKNEEEVLKEPEKSLEERVADLPPIDDEPPPIPAQQVQPPPPQYQTTSASSGSVAKDTRADVMQKQVRRVIWDDTPRQDEVQKIGAGGGMYDAISGQYMPYSMSPQGQAMREAMQQQTMQSISAANFGGSGGQYSSQNDQAGKLAFLNQNAQNQGQMKQHTALTLYTGTVVPLVLETGINTDLPGVVIARVTKNIYSSFDGRYLIIPEGSRVFATYNSSISYHQNRVQVVWNTLIRPDGLEVNLGNMNGVDVKGFSGYKGFYNGHPFEYAKAFGLIAGFSVLTTGFTVIQSNLANNIYAQNALTETGKQAMNITDKMLEKALNIQPTITVKNGLEFDLITNVDLNLPPMEVPEVKEKYVRY